MPHAYVLGRGCEARAETTTKTKNTGLSISHDHEVRTRRYLFEMNPAFRLLVVSSLVCIIILAQDFEVLETVVAQAMEQLCFSPCENGYTGHEGECVFSSFPDEKMFSCAKPFHTSLFLTVSDPRYQMPSISHLQWWRAHEHQSMRRRAVVRP
jgi:hypothetical protein